MCFDGSLIVKTNCFALQVRILLGKDAKLQKNKQSDSKAFLCRTLESIGINLK